MFSLGFVVAKDPRTGLGLRLVLIRTDSGLSSRQGLSTPDWDPLACPVMYLRFGFAARK